MAEMYRPFCLPPLLVRNSCGKSGEVAGVQAKMTSALRTWSLRCWWYSLYSELRMLNWSLGFAAARAVAKEGEV